MDKPIPHRRQEAGWGWGWAPGLQGANVASERASPIKLQKGFQFLTKDFLRFWIVDIHWEGHDQRSAPQERHKAYPTGAPRN